MTSNSPVFEIAIMARVVWDLHSLNNEGSVGNVSEPRTVVLADGTKSDGVSGEMLKHIHSAHLWLLGQGTASFCRGCATLQPQKADMPENRREAFRGIKTNAEALDAALRQCALCDLHGFLVQQPVVARRSTVEFGWAVGVRDNFHREIHLHARHAVGERQAREERQERERAQRQAEEEVEVQAQMVYHRPTRSGTYALVTLFQPWRIGLNEITYQYVQGVERAARFQLALRAYAHTFARTDGAMTSTRLPHLEGIEGVVVVGTRRQPVPVLSPLSASYRDEMQALARRTNGLEVHPFGNLEGLQAALDEMASRPLVGLRE